MTNQFFKKSAIAAAVSVALTLGGCGSDDIDDALKQMEDAAAELEAGRSSEQESTVSGVAMKGVIRQGLVAVVELDDSGNELGTVGTAVTDDTGRYSAELDDSYAGGALLMRVTADANTTMICDVHVDEGCTYGDPVALESTFKLQAVVPELEGGAAVAQITAMTNMAVERARENGGLSRQSIRSANSEVSQLVGVNVLSTEPVDITGENTEASEEALTYAAFLAGAGQVAYEDPEGMARGLEKLAESFKDGKFDEDDEVGIDRLIDAVDDEAIRSDVKNKVSALQSQIAGIRITVENGEFDPEPQDVSESSDDIAQAKVLVGEIRTWFKSFEELEDPMDAFGVEVEAAADVLNPDTNEIFEQVAAIYRAVELDLKSVTSLSDLLESDREVTYQSASGSEAFVLVNTIQNEDDTLELTVSPESGVDFSLVMNTSVNSTFIDSAIEGAEIEEPVTGDFMVSGYIENETSKLTLTDLQMVVNSATQKQPRMLEKQQGPYIQVSGGLSIEAKGKGTFSGSAEAVFVATATEESSFNNESFEPELSMMKLDGSITTVTGNELTGRFLAEASPAVAEETEEDYQNVSITANVDLELLGQPEASITVHADRTGFNDGNGIIELTRDGKTLKLVAQGYDDLEGAVTFSIADGASLKLEISEDRENSSGVLTVNKKPVGTVIIEDDELPMVRYEDGSFESLI